MIDINCFKKHIKRPTICLLILFTFFFLLIGCNKTSYQQKCEEIEVPYETQEEYTKTEYYTETVPYTDQECKNKDLIYSITDFKIDSSKCNQQEEVCHKSYPILGCTDKTVYCVDRTVLCSLTLNNLDDERGNWGLTPSCQFPWPPPMLPHRP